VEDGADRWEAVRGECYDLRERGAGLSLGIGYCWGLFGSGTIDRMAGYYMELLRADGSGT
jgi:hypothetical protein